jgi:tetratricopeptide (TPR) repeat protein
MRLLLVLIAAFLSVPATALACGNAMHFERRGNELLHQANRDFAAGRFADAAESSQHAASLLERVGQPGPARAMRRVHALSLMKLGRHLEAAPVFVKLLDGKPDPFLDAKHAEALLRAGHEVAFARGKLEALAEKGLLSDADAWVALGQARAKAGDSAGARTAFEAAVKVQPGHEDATKALAAKS